MESPESLDVMLHAGRAGTVIVETLRQARERLKLTRQELVYRTRNAIALQTIFNIETGRQKPRMTTKIVLAHALGMEPEDIAWPDGDEIAEDGGDDEGAAGGVNG